MPLNVFNFLPVFTASPKRQYLGIFMPTTPATTIPVWQPTLILIGLPKYKFIMQKPI